MMATIATILFLYWTSDLALLLYGIPYVCKRISPPKVLNDLYFYGKCKGPSENRVVKLIEIPKSWFTHFYIYGAVVSSFMVAVTFGSFILYKEVPGKQQLVEFIGMGTQRREAIDEYAVMMVCLMMFIQHLRRVYECLFISVYSKGTMNVIHYLLGLLLYSTAQICAICEGPQLNLPEKQDQLSILGRIQSVNVMEAIIVHWNKLLGFAIFLWASYYHHQSHVILANLRKDRSGQKVLHRQHVIPRGGLFEYLSAPHFVCEILIYLAMGLVALQSWTFWAGPVLLTCIGQVIMTCETHQWYRRRFNDYPVRYRIIPYIF